MTTTPPTPPAPPLPTDIAPQARGTAPEADDAVVDPTRCLWRRSGALVVDVTIVTAVVLALYWAGRVAYVDVSGRVVLPRGWAALVGLWAAWVLYWGVFEALPAHATPGKLAFGVRVVSADGSPRVGATAVLVRNLMRIPDVFLCAPAALVVTWLSVGRRRPGDMAARTLVVRRSATADGAEIRTPWSTPS